MAELSSLHTKVLPDQEFLTQQRTNKIYTITLTFKTHAQ
jgi:hypothetical protein